VAKHYEEGKDGKREYRTCIVSQAGKVLERCQTPDGFVIWAGSAEFFVLNRNWPEPRRGWHVRLRDGEDVDFWSFCLEMNGCYGGPPFGDCSRLPRDQMTLRWLTVAPDNKESPHEDMVKFFTFTMLAPTIRMTPKERGAFRAVVREELRDFLSDRDNVDAVSELVTAELT
jgi:hypothetical protein